MKDEWDTPVEKLPAYWRAIRLPKVEIQDSSRQAGMPGQTERLVEMGCGKDRRPGALQAVHHVQAKQRLVLNDEDGSPRQDRILHRAPPESIQTAAAQSARQVLIRYLLMVAL